MVWTNSRVHHFENTGIGAKFRCYWNFFMMVRVHKKQNNHK